MADQIDLADFRSPFGDNNNFVDVKYYDGVRVRLEKDGINFKVNVITEELDVYESAIDPLLLKVIRNNRAIPPISKYLKSESRGWTMIKGKKLFYREIFSDNNLGTKLYDSDFNIFPSLRDWIIYGSFVLANILFLLSTLYLLIKRNNRERLISITVGVLWVVSSGIILMGTGLGAMATGHPAPPPSIFEIFFSLPLYGAGLIHSPVFPLSFLAVNALAVGIAIPLFYFHFYK